MTNLPTPELQAAVERVTADLAVTCPEGSKWSNALVGKADLRLILAALEARGKALEFYRDEWRCALQRQPDDEDRWYPSEALHDDCGKTARRALTALGGAADV